MALSRPTGGRGNSKEMEKSSSLRGMYDLRFSQQLLRLLFFGIVIQLIFQRKILPPFSGLKRKPSDISAIKVMCSP
jgi:hypothetical protein